MNLTKLQLVFFVPSLDGGIGRVTALLAQGMHASGKKVEVWCAAPKSGYAKKLENEIKVRYLGDGSVKSALFPMIRELRKQSSITIISASFHANCIALIASIFSFRSTQIIIVDHPSIDSALNELSYLKRFIWKILILMLYPIADKHIAISKGVAKAMSKYSGIDLSKITVIPNPVITDEIFAQGSVLVHHQFFDLSEPILLYVGRLSFEKDVPNLIKAFKKVQNNIASRLLIVGDGPERDKLEELVRQGHIEDRVSFLGHQDNPYSYFAQSDLFVLSSTREGLPTVLIEALAFGLKVVSTDCPSGPSEILKNGEYGRLVRLSDSSALADSITLSLKDPKITLPEAFFEQYKVESVVNLYKRIVNS